MKYSLSAKNLVSRNLESRASYCAGLVNPGHTKEITSILRSDSGLLSYTFNQVVTNAVMPAQILKRFVVDYFAERHSPFTLWHCGSKSLDVDEMGELSLAPRDPLVAMAAEVPRLAVEDTLPEALDGKLSFRAVTDADLEAFSELQVASFDDAREAAQVHKFYQTLVTLPEQKRSRLKYFMALMDGQPVASGSLFASAEALGIYDLYTLPDFRGRGVGLAFLHYLFEQVQHSHHKHVVALTPESRQQAYLDVGFYAVGEVGRFRFNG